MRRLLRALPSRGDILRSSNGIYLLYLAISALGLCLNLVFLKFYAHGLNDDAPRATIIGSVLVVIASLNGDQILAKAFALGQEWTRVIAEIFVARLLVLSIAVVGASLLYGWSISVLVFWFCSQALYMRAEFDLTGRSRVFITLSILDRLVAIGVLVAGLVAGPKEVLFFLVLPRLTLLAIMLRQGRGNSFGVSGFALLTFFRSHASEIAYSWLFSYLVGCANIWALDTSSADLAKRLAIYSQFFTSVNVFFFQKSKFLDITRYDQNFYAHFAKEIYSLLKFSLVLIIPCAMTLFALSNVYQISFKPSWIMSGIIASFLLSIIVSLERWFLFSRASYIVAITYMVGIATLFAITKIINFNNYWIFPYHLSIIAYIIIIVSFFMLRKVVRSGVPEKSGS